MCGGGGGGGRGGGGGGGVVNWKVGEEDWAETDIRSGDASCMPNRQISARRLGGKRRGGVHRPVHNGSRGPTKGQEKNCGRWIPI